LGRGMKGGGQEREATGEPLVTLVTGGEMTDVERAEKREHGNQRTAFGKSRK